MKQLVFMLFLLAVVSCVPVSSTKMVGTNTPVFTIPPSPTTTSIPSPVPTSTSVPTPGPDLAALYIDNGQIKRFDLRTWTGETLSLSNTVRFATLSTDGQMLAYGDETGFYLSEFPFTDSKKMNKGEMNPDINARSLLFNPDSTLLAFSDEEGLKIFHRSDNHSELLVKNNMRAEDMYSFRDYLPFAWSPDSRLLWADVGFWGDTSSVITNIVSDHLSNYLHCYSDVDWLTQSTLIGTVYYSGRSSCGFEPGVYIISVKGEQIEETRGYADEVNPAENQEFADLSLSPSKKHMTLVEILGYEENFLFLMDINGDNVREILKTNSFEEGFTSVFWSPSEREVFYSSGRDIYVYSLEKGESTLLYENTEDPINIASISPDGKWFFLNNFTMYSIETGEVISLAENSSEPQEQIFIGWLKLK
jgi:hypothetical protein